MDIDDIVNEAKKVEGESSQKDYFSGRQDDQADSPVRRSGLNKWLYIMVGLGFTMGAICIFRDRVVEQENNRQGAAAQIIEPAKRKVAPGIDIPLTLDGKNAIYEYKDGAGKCYLRFLEEGKPVSEITDENCDGIADHLWKKGLPIFMGRQEISQAGRLEEFDSYLVRSKKEALDYITKIK